MAPVATHLPSDDISKSTVPEKGPALVIGSLSTAQDGKYQRVVSELEATRQVERQMLDRLLDRGNMPGFSSRHSHSRLQKPLFSLRVLMPRFTSLFHKMITKPCNHAYQNCFPYYTRGSPR